MTATPRPALRRANDADIHPALAVVPAKEASTLRRSARPGDDSAKPDSGKSGSGKKGKKGKRYQGAGRSTSDTMRPGSNKKVDLKVKVPKSMRKEIRAISKASGASPDELVTEVLNAWLGDPRRL